MYMIPALPLVPSFELISQEALQCIPKTLRHVVFFFSQRCWLILALVWKTALWMGYQCISTDLKQHALWLLDNGYLAHKVQEIFNVSHSSMGLLQNPLQGCPHSLTVTQTHSLIQMVQNTSNIYLYELPDWLALEHDIMVSWMTLHHIIQDAGLSYKLLRWCAME